MPFRQSSQRLGNLPGLYGFQQMMRSGRSLPICRVLEIGFFRSGSWVRLLNLDVLKEAGNISNGQTPLLTPCPASQRSMDTLWLELSYNAYPFSTHETIGSAVCQKKETERTHAVF